MAAAPKRRSARRTPTSTRGAALVEAAIAIPVMLIFVGTTVFAHRSYEEKIALQMSARAEALYHASHNCTQEAPRLMSRQLGASAGSNGTPKERNGADTTGGAGGALDKASHKLGESERQGVSRFWNMVKVHRSSRVTGSAVQEQKRVDFSRTITANAEVGCNEKRSEDDASSAFDLISRFARNGGGFLD